jgi:hypothetical protein
MNFPYNQIASNRTTNKSTREEQGWRWLCNVLRNYVLHVAALLYWVRRSLLLPLVSSYNKRRAIVTFAHSWRLHLMNVTNQDESIAHLRKSACVLCVAAAEYAIVSPTLRPRATDSIFAVHARGAHRVETKRECALAHFHKRSTPWRATVIIYITMRWYWAVTLNLVFATIIFRESPHCYVNYSDSLGRGIYNNLITLFPRQAGMPSQECARRTRRVQSLFETLNRLSFLQRDA